MSSIIRHGRYWIFAVNKTFDLKLSYRAIYKNTSTIHLQSSNGTLVLAYLSIANPTKTELSDSFITVFIKRSSSYSDQDADKW